MLQSVVATKDIDRPEGASADRAPTGEVIAFPARPAVPASPQFRVEIAGATARPTRWALNVGPEEHLLTICLRHVRIAIRAGGRSALEGPMRIGAVLVTGPGQEVSGEPQGPCDFVHLRIANDLMRSRSQASNGSGDLDGLHLHDPMIEQLAPLLASEAAERDPIYAGALVQTLLTRLVHLAQARPRIGALPKWRLRRVEALVEARLAEPLSLSHLAQAAGLSRMYFAAQFKIATGYSPHDYLLHRRIEAAKAMLIGSDESLVDIALNVGFLAQAHFTTVFKRLTGETPARWRRAHRIEPDPSAQQRRRRDPDHYSYGYAA